MKRSKKYTKQIILTYDDFIKPDEIALKLGFTWHDITELDARVTGEMLPYVRETRSDPAEGGYLEDFAVSVFHHIENLIDITDMIDPTRLAMIEEISNEEAADEE